MNVLYKRRSFAQKIIFKPVRVSFAELSNFTFVPKYNPVKEEDLEALGKFLSDNCRICVLTGAGVSTESGIPDYRSAGVGLYARSNRKPMLYKDFCSSELARKRYWARNYVGWPRFSSIEPNDTHKLLKALEDENKVKYIITQNVDNLHTKAGSSNVIELHGTAFQVMCLHCPHKMSRFDLQDIFDKLNPNMTATSEMIRPDGDVDLSQEQVEEFRVPPCPNCGGVLKPDIVFFGDNVPRERVELIQQSVEKSDSMLILGTTLSTYSGYRIVLQAVQAKMPISLINIGESRADDLINLNIQGRCSEVLSKVWPLHKKHLSCST